MMRPSRELPPPTLHDPGDWRDRGWTLLTVAASHLVAHLIKGRLTEEGIEVLLDSTNQTPGAWLYPFGNPSAPVKVFVRRDQLEWAELSLGEVAASPPVDGPEPRVRTRWQRVMLALVVATVLALSLIEVLDSVPCLLGLFCR